MNLGHKVNKSSWFIKGLRLLEPSPPELDGAYSNLKFVASLPEFLAPPFCRFKLMTQNSSSPTNPVIENIFTRSSVRAFTGEAIPEEILKVIAEAGVHAPSGMNRQTWKFTVLTNKAKIEELAKAVGEVLGRKGYDFYKPAALIIPSNDKFDPEKRETQLGRDDNACALQNIFLAAHSFGIGSVWINQLQGICGNEKIRPLLTGLGIPEEHEVFGLAALGYPKEEPHLKPRKDVITFVK